MLKEILNTDQLTNNMKIILQTTDSESKYARSAEVRVGYDDLNIHEVWEDLIVPALLAYGFARESIDKING